MRRDKHEERQNEEILGVLDHGESSFISRGYVQVLCFSMMDQRIVSKKEYCSSPVKSVMNCITIKIVSTFCCILCTVFMNATQKREIVNFLWSEDTAKFWRSSSVALHQERNQAFLNSAILFYFLLGAKVRTRGVSNYVIIHLHLCPSVSSSKLVAVLNLWVGTATS